MCNSNLMQIEINKNINNNNFQYINIFWDQLKNLKKYFFTPLDN